MESDWSVFIEGVIRMRALAPLALTGVASVILWKILAILMAPVAAWMIGILAIFLKVVLVLCVCGLAFYGIKRVLRARSEADAEA